MIYEMVDMKKWRTKKDLLKELKSNGVELTERGFRKIVENINRLFYNHEIDVFIGHSDKGYIATQDDEIIKQSALDYRKRAMDQLVKYSKICRAIGENINLKLDLDDKQIMMIEKEILE